MATGYGGMGDTFMENLISQDVDSDSQKNYQEKNIISLQHLTHEMEQLRQTVEDKDNDPRDAIQQLGKNLINYLSHFAPLQSPLKKY